MFSFFLSHYQAGISGAEELAEIPGFLAFSPARPTFLGLNFQSFGPHGSRQDAPIVWRISTVCVYFVSGLATSNTRPLSAFEATKTTTTTTARLVLRSASKVIDMNNFAASNGDGKMASPSNQAEFVYLLASRRLDKTRLEAREDKFKLCLPVTLERSKQTDTSKQASNQAGRQTNREALAATKKNRIHSTCLSWPL